MIAMTRDATRIRFFFPTILKAQMRAVMIAMSKKRGCINVARANHPPTDATAIQNFLSTGLFNVARIVLAIIKKQAAIGDSYPTAMEERESVGLNERITETKTELSRAEQDQVAYEQEKQAQYTGTDPIVRKRLGLQEQSLEEKTKERNIKDK